MQRPRQYKCVRVRGYVHACVHVCMRTCVRACVRTYVRACVCSCMRTYVYGCVHQNSIIKIVIYWNVHCSKSLHLTSGVEIHLLASHIHSSCSDQSTDSMYGHSQEGLDSLQCRESKLEQVSGAVCCFVKILLLTGIPARNAIFRSAWPCLYFILRVVKQN